MRLKLSSIAALAAIAGLVLGACGGDEDGEPAGDEAEATEISFVQPVPGGESTFFYPIFVGQELGYFEEEGVSVTSEPASEQIPITGFVQNGNVDVGSTGDEEILPGAAEGGEYKVVYDYYTKTGEALSVPADSDIESVADLEGATVGLAAQDDRTFARAALEAGGIDPESVDTPTVGRGGPPIAEALRSGRIDAYSSGISDFAIVEGAGIELRNITPEELADRPPASFLVLPSTIDERGDALAGFMRAWSKAAYVGFVDPEVVEAIGREAVPGDWENEDVGEAILDVTLESTEPQGDTFGEIRPELWENSQQQLLDAGVIEEPVDLETLLDDQFIEEANDWDRSEVEADVEQWVEDHPDQIEEARG